MKPRCALPRAFVLALSTLVAMLPVNAQDAPSSSGQVFRGAVDLVQVDAYPRRDGAIVEGLTVDDFRILEDGVPQAISTFEFVRHPSGAPVDRLEPRNSGEADRWIADPARRILIAYFDLYHMSRASSHVVRNPLLDALGQMIGPSDLVAVMTPETPVGELKFTQRLNTLAAELARYWEWGLADAPVQPRTPAEKQLAACGNSVDGYRNLVLQQRDVVLLTSLESLIERIGALRQQRTHIILVSEGWLNRSAGIHLRNPRALPLPGVGDVRHQVQIEVPQREHVFAQSSECSLLLFRLQAVDFEQWFYRLIRLANAANVSFHTLDPGGLRTSAASGSRQTRMLQELAGNTDGMWTVNSNDMTLGFRRTVEATSAYYLMGYVSSNTTIDGKYRRITVDVARRGVSVTARRGYYALSPEVHAAAETRDARAVVPAPEADAIGQLSRWRDDDQLLVAASPTPAGVRVVAEIGRRELASGNWRNGADVEVELSDRDGRVDVVSGRIPPGARSVELLAAMTTAGVPARASVRVRNEAKELTARIDVAPRTDTWLGAARFFRVPTARRAAPQPVAAPLFQRGERLRVEWLTQRETTEARARLLDRRGQTLAPGAALASAFDSAQGVLVVDLHLNALAEGDYLLEAVAGADGESDRQLVAFQVTR